MSNEEEANSFKQEANNYCMAITTQFIQLLNQNGTFGFNLKFVVNGKTYQIIGGEQTTKFEYLKEN